MTLVVAIGGVRSGKSAWAEGQAAELAGAAPVTVLATADPADRSMADRIERHVRRRPPNWPVALLHGADELAPALPSSGVALLDGLGGWVAGLLERSGAFAEDPAGARAGVQRAGARAHAAMQALIDAAGGEHRALVVASEETGLGVVPLGAGTAAWVDLVGELNQRLVRAADLAVVVVAGRALPLTDAARPLSRPAAGPSLSIVAGQGAPAGAATPPAGDRRAHPRLVGAGTPARGALPELDPEPGRAEAANPGPTVPAEAGAAPTTAGRPLPADVLGDALAADRDADAGSPAPAPTALPAAELAALRSHGDRLVQQGDADHAVNVVASGPPAWLVEALSRTLAHDLSRYPDAGAAQAVLAALHGRPAEEVVVTNGAAEALWLLPAALRPALAAVIHPCFTEAEAALHAHGVLVRRIHRDPERDFAIDPAAVPDEAELVVVGNPAAASGTLAARDAILALRRPGRTIVVDEAFMDLVPGEAESLAPERAPDLVVVRSFTKSLSIPGVRAGCALAAGPIADRLRAVQPPWSVNAFAASALAALGAHAGELQARATQADAERGDLETRLSGLPALRTWPSATNHLLVHHPQGAALAAALREARIAVRPCGSFPGLTDDHLRITARDPAANARLVAAIAVALAPGGTGGSSPDPDPDAVA